MAAAWFPLMLLGATLAIREQSWRWAVATGAALGMSVLHGVQHCELSGRRSPGLLVWALALVAARRFSFRVRDGLRCVSGLDRGLVTATAAALSAAAWLSLLGLLSSCSSPGYRAGSTGLLGTAA